MFAYGRLKSSLTWRGEWTGCARRHLSQSLLTLESLSVMSRSMTQRQCLAVVTKGTGICAEGMQPCRSPLSPGRCIKQQTDSSTCSETPALLPALAGHKAQVWAGPRGKRSGNRIWEMANVKVGEGRLNRKIAGHKNTLKLVLIIVMPTYWVYSSTVTCTFHVSSHLILITTA